MNYLLKLNGDEVDVAFLVNTQSIELDIFIHHVFYCC